MNSNNIKTLITANTAPWKNITIPDGYTLTFEGVRLNSGDRISGAAWVSSHTNDEQTGTFGLVINWIDRRGNLVEQAFPFDVLHEQGKAFAQMLARKGLDIKYGKENKVNEYLTNFSEETWKQSVSRVGWLDNKAGDLVFITPNGEGCISLKQRDRIIFQPEQHSPTTTTMHASGTLEEWQSAVANHCAGNPYLIFSLCLAFAAPLLKHAGLESGGFHFYGRSSRGKTTAAQVAASVFGCGADPADSPDQSYLQRWNTTGNALEGLLSAHNDTLLILDEIHTCDAKDFGRVIYNITGGKGKAAMDKNRNLKPQRAWRTVILSTGEISSQQKIEEDNKKAHAGQLLRMLDIPTDSDIIKDTHGMKPGDFVCQLKQSCSQHYGTAGTNFINRLIKKYDNSHTLGYSIKERLTSLSSNLTPDNARPEQERAIKRFALVKLAGQLAMEFGILNIDTNEIDNAIRHILTAWKNANTTLPDGQRGLLKLQAFIHRNQGRFQPAQCNNVTTRDLAGYTSKADELYLFIPEGFAEACGGHNITEVVRELDRQGLLRTNEPGRYQVKYGINGMGRPRVYAVNMAIVDFDFEPQDND